MTKRILSPTFLFIAADFALGAAAYSLSYLLRYQLNIDAAGEYIGPLVPRAVSFAVLVMLGMLAMGLYRARQRPRAWETVARVSIGVLIGTVCCIVLFYFLPDLSTGRGALMGALLIAVPFVSYGRIKLLKLVDRNPVKTRVLVLGTESTALKIGRLRRASDRRRFEILGYVVVDDEDWPRAKRIPELRPLIPLRNAVDFPRVDEVVVAMDERRGVLPIDVLLQFKGRGIPVTDIVDFLERETGRIDLDLITPAWFVYTTAGYTNGLFRATKRFVDIMLSALVFSLTSPIFATVVAMIWLEDGIRTPILYRQRRVGLGGKPFELLKFRSMRTDAEAKSGPKWAVKGDARVTRVGRLIRRFRIDELPQLLNIFRGEMSIVGPRPERPEFVEMLSREVPMFGVRHNMRPGLTGWAQLNFPYGASVTDAREKLSYDIYYLKNSGVILDLLIFLQTIEVVVWGKAISMAGAPRPAEPSSARSRHSQRAGIQGDASTRHASEPGPVTRHETAASSN